MKHNGFYLQKPQTFDQSPLLTATVHKKSMTHEACTWHGTAHLLDTETNTCAKSLCARHQMLFRNGSDPRPMKCNYPNSNCCLTCQRVARSERRARSSKSDTRHICVYRERISRHALCGAVTGQTV